jgi:thiol:disulfide interchange protein DsbC
MTISLNASVSDIEKKLVKSIIPGSSIKKIEKTPIDGLYMVLLENEKFLYVYPYKELIIFGEILTSKGKNISTFLKEDMRKDDVVIKNNLDVILKNSKALLEMQKLALSVTYNKGSSEYAFYLFTDPDCPFCKNIDEMFHGANAEVRYILTPSQKLHPKAFYKSQQLVSNQDKFSNILMKIRSDENITVSVSKESEEKVLEMMKLADKLNISGTPMTLVFDKKKKRIIDFIEGADIGKLKNYIKENDD